jgi:hypothetical protein
MDAILTFLASVVREGWDVLGQMSPYLLLGFLVAGGLSVLLPESWVAKHLGGRGIGPVIRSSLVGVPLPLCSCGVIPVSAGLRRSGASRAATTSFLLSTPQTGVDSIAATWALLGPVFAIYRPVAAFLTGVIGGLLVEGFAPEEADPAPAPEGARHTVAPDASPAQRAWEAIRYGLVVLPKDIGWAMLGGLAAAGLIGVVVPEDFFAAALGTGLLSILVLMLAGIPIYVCATASIPIAAAFVLKGASPGAALAFLVTGPATNAATIAVVGRVLGRRVLGIYLLTISGCAVAAALLLNRILSVAEVQEHAHGAAGWWGWVETLGGVVLLLILVNALRPRAGGKPEPEAGEGDMTDGETLRVAVEGMTCSHCAMSVESALKELPGVTGAHVDLDAKQARVTGAGVDETAVREAIESVGYDVRGVSRENPSGGDGA